MADVRLYRPSNGTEGECFIGRWCATCVRDAASRDPDRDPADGCDILARTFALSIDDPDYPREWRNDGPSGPRCTAWRAEDDDRPPPLDPSAALGLLL